jgi:integrase
MTGSGLSGLLAVSGMRLGEVIRLDRPDLDTAEAVVNRRLGPGRGSWFNKETGAVPAPGKFDEETRARAVRLYTDRLRDHGESKLAARRHVGQLLEVKPATLRNWIEPEQRASASAGPATDDSDTALKCATASG